MGVTSCRWITITGTIAHRRCGAQPGSSPLPCRWRTRRRPRWRDTVLTTFTVSTGLHRPGDEPGK